MESLLILNKAGVLVFEFQATKNNRNDLNNVLLAGFLAAVGNFAQEIGGGLNTITMQNKKITYQNFKLFNEELMLVVFDDFKTKDEILKLKAEIILRMIFSYYRKSQSEENSDISPPLAIDMFFESFLPGLIMKEIKTLKGQNEKKLFNLLDKFPSPYEDIEKELSKILKEIPIPQDLLNDPRLILIGRKRFIIPVFTTHKEIENLILQLEETIGKILGEGFQENLVNKIMDALNN